MKTYAPKYNAVVNLGNKQECQCTKSAVGQFFASWLGLWLYACKKHLRTAHRDGLRTETLDV